MLKLFIHITRDETGNVELKTNVQDKSLLVGLLEVAKSAVLVGKHLILTPESTDAGNSKR